MPRNKEKRGWFGDSAAHSAAGRKGGRARSQNQQAQKAQEDSSATEDRRELAYKDKTEM